MALNASYMVKVYKDLHVQEANNKLARDIQELKDQIKILYQKQLEVEKKANTDRKVLLNQMKGVSETLNMTNCKLYRDLQPATQLPITPSWSEPEIQTPEP